MPWWSSFGLVADLFDLSEERIACPSAEVVFPSADG